MANWIERCGIRIVVDRGSGTVEAGGVEGRWEGARRIIREEGPMPKKVQINFALKTPAELASRLGVSKRRTGRLLTIISKGRSLEESQRSGDVAFKSKNGGAVSSRPARRNNAKTTR
jgi:hypothetical protein